MSVCLCQQLSGEDAGCLWSEGRLQRRLHGEERARSSALLLSVLARVVWALGLLDILLSVGGQSFVAPFSTAPQGQCCVSSLDVAVGQVGGHKRKYAAMALSSSRAIVVDALPLSRRPVPLVGWLVFSVSIFAGWPSWGASRPDGKKTALTGTAESGTVALTACDCL